MGKKQKGDGHHEGQMPGNMMAHADENAPFKGTGYHPSNLSEVPLSELTETPPAMKLDAKYKAKLADSLPYSLPSIDSWTGGSGSIGGKTAKTRKG